MPTAHFILPALLYQPISETGTTMPQLAGVLFGADSHIPFSTTPMNPHRTGIADKNSINYTTRKILTSRPYPQTMLGKKGK